MKSEIITIGDELLIGQTIDTNSAWMGSEMSLIGFDIWRRTSIHDNRQDILNMLHEVSGRSDVVLITGGLGPTTDDITKQVLCEFFNTRLVLDPEVLLMIKEMMTKRQFPMNENNRRQAEVPESCRVLKNDTGTAPGMWFEKDGTIFISMPGVPYEMKYIMSTYVIPELKERFTSQVIIHRNIMTYGIPEARLAELLKDFESSLPENIKLAYLPSLGVIKLRLTAIGGNRHTLETILSNQVINLNSIIPDYVFAYNEESFETVIGKLLKERNQTICTAESCTGGRIATLLTSVPGSSAYFKGSIIAYDNSIKIQLLQVREKLITVHGAVSEQVVIKMAEGIRKLFRTDFSVATSGIAGPDGGTEAKPVGTVYVAVASDKGTITSKHIFGNNRTTNIDRFSIAALHLLRKQIINQINSIPANRIKK
jgi:nicotinamide-nucleotide amidase